MPDLDLNWLDSFVEQLPIPEPIPANLFDILGVATRETVVSNLLAYYLDEQNPHGLGRLFLDSLIACMHSVHSPISVEQCASPYTVERETNNIDILIQGDTNAWAILIENKVFHILDNDLGRYWESVNNASKFGVVVSLKPIESKATYQANFVNITHKAWLNEVKKAMPTGKTGAHSDDLHTLLFTNFLTTMTNNTADVSDNPANNKAIELFQVHQAKIARLLTTQTNLQTYIQRHINAAFEKYSFVEGQPKRFYYPNAKQPENQPVPPLRFFVDETILTRNTLSIYFELHGTATSLGPEMVKHIAQFQPLPDLQFYDKDKKDKAEGVFYHLAYIVDQPVLPTDNFPAKLDEIIGRFVGKGPSGVSLVDHCRQFWQQQNLKNESLQ